MALQQILVDYSKHVCKESHVPVLLGAYGASMSGSDQRILKVSVFSYLCLPLVTLLTMILADFEFREAPKWVQYTFHIPAFIQLRKEGTHEHNPASHLGRRSRDALRNRVRRQWKFQGAQVGADYGRTT